MRLTARLVTEYILCITRCTGSRFRKIRETTTLGYPFWHTIAPRPENCQKSGNSQGNSGIGIPVCVAIVVVTGTSACGWTQEHPRRRRRDHKTSRLTSPRTLVGRQPSQQLRRVMQKKTCDSSMVVHALNLVVFDQELVDVAESTSHDPKAVVSLNR
jgi:hypothetical protein